MGSRAPLRSVSSDIRATAGRAMMCRQAIYDPAIVTYRPFGPPTDKVVLTFDGQPRILEQAPWTRKDGRRFLIDYGALGYIVTLAGRQLWALERLMEAGEAGCTALSHPAPRWEYYVAALRRKCVAVEARPEPDDCLYLGRLTRFILRCPVREIAPLSMSEGQP